MKKKITATLLWVKKYGLKSHYRRPPRKCTHIKSICVDVDGTLISKRGILNDMIVEYCRAKKADGFDIVLWSARGRVYAEKVADRFGVRDLFTAIIGKPGYILDDIGWEWARDVVHIKYEDIKN